MPLSFLVISMRKLQIKDADIMEIAVRNEICRSEDARYDHRLHGILLICRGMSCYEVGEILGHSPRAIENWVKRFETNGFAGLEEKPRTGRQPRLEFQNFVQIGKELRRNPYEFGYTQNLWDGKLLSYHLSKVYNVQLGVRQCQRLFHKFQFRRRKPRAVIANADPLARERFKKTKSRYSSK